MSVNRRGQARWTVVALIGCTALLAVAAGVAAGQNYDASDADTTLQLNGGTYYTGQKLFFRDGLLQKVDACPDRYQLETVKGRASVSTDDGVETEIYRVSESVEPDGNCDVIFDTSNLKPGMYGVFRRYDLPTGVTSTKVPSGHFTLKEAETVGQDESDSGDDGSDDDGDGTGDGGSDDTATAVLPGYDQIPEDADSLQNPSRFADDVDWNRMFPASLTVNGGIGKPGRTVTVGFTLTNTGNESEAYILELTDLPDALEVASRDDAGGTWNEDRWLFQSIDAGGTVKPSIAVRLPNATVGSGVPRWTVRAHVESENFVVARGSDEVAAVSNASLCQAIAGTDGVIGDSEVIEAANAWDDGEPLPSVGLVVGDEQILAIIEAWRDGTDCGGFTLPEPPAAVTGQDFDEPVDTGAAMPGG